MESKLSGIFQVKVVTKNLVLSACLCSMISLFEERYKFSEPNCYTLVFSLLNSTLFSFMWKECHFV